MNPSDLTKRRAAARRALDLIDQAALEVDAIDPNLRAKRHFEVIAARLRKIAGVTKPSPVKPPSKARRVAMALGIVPTADSLQ